MNNQMTTLTTMLAIFSLFLSLNVFAFETKSIAKEINASTLNIEQGKKLWEQKFIGEAPFQNRSCTSCHGEKLVLAGKHIRTNKVIEPMALSTNPERLKNKAKVEKWFLRNCKWTIGRECTIQEKSNIIAYLKSQ